MHIYSLVDQDSLLRFAVHINSNQMGIMVHPGSTIKPRLLAMGWQYHWPLLSVIRVINTTPVEIIFSQNEKQNQAVIAVTHDHRLVRLEGAIILQVIQDASLQTLAKLNKHSHGQLLLPLIRSAMRQSIAQTAFNELDSQLLIQNVAQSLSKQLKDYGIAVRSMTIASMQEFEHPLHKRFRPQQSAEA